jgi:hypothetical protein
MQQPMCMNDAPNPNREQAILYALIAGLLAMWRLARNQRHGQ